MTPGGRVWIVCVVSMALLASGCSTASDGERLFWSAQRINAPIATDPGRATPEQFADAIAAFERVIRTARGTEWAARAHVAIGSLYALQGQYDSARDAYDRVLLDHAQRKDLCLTARVATAKTYEVERRWEDAVQVYQDLSEFHPWSTLGLEAPLHIAAIYERQGEPGRGVEARERAVLTYLKAISMAPTSETAAQAKSYLALAYHQLGNWDAAVKTLEELAALPAGVNRPLVLLSLGSLYEAQRGRQQAAEQASTRLASESSEPPSARGGGTRLEHLGMQLIAQRARAGDTNPGADFHAPRRP